MKKHINYCYIQSKYFFIILRTSNKDIQQIVNFCVDLKISHPLMEFNDEALKLVLDLKSSLSKFTIFQKQNIDEELFDNISKRRIILTKKLLILEVFCTYFKKYIILDEDEKRMYPNELFNSKDISTYKFNINGTNFNLKELLWTLKFTIKLFNDDLKEDNVLSTRMYLDANFDFETYSIKNSENNKIIYKNEETDAHIYIGNHKVEVEVENEDDYNKTLNKNEEEYQNIDEDENENNSCTCGLNIADKNKDFQYESSNLQENKFGFSINSNTENKSEIDEKMNIIKTQEENVKSLVIEKKRLEDQKHKAEYVLWLIKNFCKVYDSFKKNNNNFGFIIAYIHQLEENDNSFDFSFIKGIIDFYFENEEDILDGKFSDYNEYDLQMLEEYPEEERLDYKMNLVKQTFAQIESFLFSEVQKIFDS